MHQLTLTDEEVNLLHHFMATETMKLPDQTWLPACSCPWEDDCLVCNLYMKLYSLWKEVHDGNLSQDSDAIQA